MMIDAGGRDCPRREHQADGRGGPVHDKETAPHARRGDKNMSGCHMMGGTTEAQHRGETRGPAAREPHADLRP